MVAEPVVNTHAGALPYRAFILVGILRYPAARVDYRFTDGATIRVGPVALTAHITAGSTRGCTSWSFPVRDGDRELQVVRICDLMVQPGMSLVEPENYPGIRADFERSFRVLRSLPVDIFLTAHAREFGRYLIDRDGYFRHIDTWETRFRTLLEDQQRRSSRWGSTLAGAVSRWGWQ